MKRCMVILLILVMAISLFVGCTPVAENAETGNRFVIVYNNNSNLIYADTETGVMYLYHGGGYSGGMSVMVDAEGNPLIWDFQK